MSLQSPLHGETNVEGRYPNVFPAGEVAAAGGKTAEYLDAKAFDDDFYAHKILQFICQNGVATRSKIDGWISKHLSSTLSPEQKRNKVGNLLSYVMKTKHGWIMNTHGARHSSWVLTPSGVEECRRINPKCKRICPEDNAGQL